MCYTLSTNETMGSLRYREGEMRQAVAVPPAYQWFQSDSNRRCNGNLRANWGNPRVEKTGPQQCPGDTDEQLAPGHEPGRRVVRRAHAPITVVRNSNTTN